MMENGQNWSTLKYRAVSVLTSKFDAQLCCALFQGVSAGSDLIPKAHCGGCERRSDRAWHGDFATL